MLDSYERAWQDSLAKNDPPKVRPDLWVQILIQRDKLSYAMQRVRWLQGHYKRGTWIQTRVGGNVFPDGYKWIKFDDVRSSRCLSKRFRNDDGWASFGDINFKYMENRAYGIGVGYQSWRQCFPHEKEPVPHPRLRARPQGATEAPPDHD